MAAGEGQAAAAATQSLPAPGRRAGAPRGSWPCSAPPETPNSLPLLTGPSPSSCPGRGSGWGCGRAGNGGGNRGDR